MSNEYEIKQNGIGLREVFTVSKNTKMIAIFFDRKYAQFFVAALKALDEITAGEVGK